MSSHLLAHSKWFVTLIFWFLLGYANAQSVVIQGEEGAASFGEQLSYYIESEGEHLDIMQVTSSGFDTKWLKTEQQHLSLGYITPTIWCKFEVQNLTNSEDWYLIIDMPFTDSITFYKQDLLTQKWQSHTCGWHYPYSARTDIGHSGFPFALDLAAGQRAVYYIKIRSAHPILLPMSVQRLPQVYRSSQYHHIGYGIFFGVMCVMILYNLMIFIQLRDLNYLYYILTIIATLSVFGSVSGHFFQYLYPNTPVINSWIILACMAATVITTSNFAISFLAVKQYSKWLYRLFLFMIGFSLIALALNLWGVKGLINNTVKIQTLLLLVSGIYCWRKGNKYARFFVVAWVTYIIGGLLITLRNSGTLPINFWTSHGAEIGSGLEVVLISVALADRYRYIRKEKEKAVRKSLAIEQRSKQELEVKVKERTQQLNESNEELSQTNEELAVTLETLELQNQEIQLKSTAIQDSINYAQRIQSAILPSQVAMTSFLAAHFVLFLPRDVVSGDFYFFSETPNHAFLAVADCTGHGVPGALMSMIGTNLLHQAIKEKEFTDPAVILSFLDSSINSLLKQSETGNRDGMDIGICVFDKVAKNLHFSGANIPLLCIGSREVRLIKTNRVGVGGVFKKQQKKFESEVLPWQDDICFYMYSDGYQDQFGGEHNRKFMRKNLINMLADYHHLAFDVQKERIYERLKAWQAPHETEQLDDILILGFRLSQ